MHRAKSMIVRLRPSSPALESDSGENGFPRRSRLLSLESLMSFGLGSGAHGATISGPVCANQSNRTHVYKGCSLPGTISCSVCYLVKYCSDRCQKLHSQRHRKTCAHPYMQDNWEPAWVLEQRKPMFRPKDVYTRHVWGDIPAIDILRLEYNEELDCQNKDLKICLAASGDIRTLVQTVNALPKDYTGTLHILVNDIDPIVVNRNLVILFALLGAGPSIEEAAELATHLMYSAALPHAAAAYVQRCIDYVYGCNWQRDGRLALHTRGEGKIHAMQAPVGMKAPLEMFRSTFDILTATKAMRSTLNEPANVDEHERLLSKLLPAHRVAFGRYRETGILAPFGFNCSSFVHPNRLLFTARGAWMPGSASPLCGWDLSAVIASGERHSIDPADIFGCLFFHVKSQLREFASRMARKDIHVHLTQFDARVLSKGLLAGVLPAFDGACLDRVDLSHLMDEQTRAGPLGVSSVGSGIHHGVGGILADWGPLMNKANPRAAMVMHSRSWHEGRADASLRDHPKTVEWLMKKCFSIPGMDTNPDLHLMFSQGMHSPSPMLLHLIESLDAFYDNEGAFRRYLRLDQRRLAEVLGLRMRDMHRIHAKRFGVPVGAVQQRLPDLGREEFYRLFTLGEASLLVRFIEFEMVDEKEKDGWF